MSRKGVAEATRMASGAARSFNVCRTSSRLTPAISRIALPSSMTGVRSFSVSPIRTKGIMPHTENPAKEAAKSESTYTVAEVTESQYHELADIYLENLLSKFEDLQDEREDIDVEFSSGVMTISFPGKGTYVLNKQPPNKQIWLSSPISGPKRYDWCIIGESQNDKEGTASGDWIYNRDNSSLSQLLAEELGVDVSIPHDE